MSQPIIPSRPIHFELQAQDVRRACAFYAAVFGWRFEDYSGFTGSPYFSALTGPDGTPGINGAIVQRSVDAPEREESPNAAVLTMGVADYDAVAERVLDNGGDETVHKFALPGLAWQGYFRDTEGNTFGVHQPDPKAS